jgi:hypothetical protein
VIVSDAGRLSLKEGAGSEDAHYVEAPGSRTRTSLGDSPSRNHSRPRFTSLAILFLYFLPTQGYFPKALVQLSTTLIGGEGGPFGSRNRKR